MWDALHSVKALVCRNIATRSRLTAVDEQKTVADYKLVTRVLVRPWGHVHSRQGMRSCRWRQGEQGGQVDKVISQPGRVEGTACCLKPGRTGRCSGFQGSNRARTVAVHSIGHATELSPPLVPALHFNCRGQPHSPLLTCMRNKLARG